VSVQEILYPRCILGHKIGGFRASEGLSEKHERLSQEYFFGLKNVVLIVLLLEIINEGQYRRLIV